MTPGSGFDENRKTQTTIVVCVFPFVGMVALREREQAGSAYRERMSRWSTVRVPIDSFSMRVSRILRRLMVMAPTATAPIAAAPKATAPIASAPIDVAPPFTLVMAVSAGVMVPRILACGAA
jgi:hypothetical protein